VAAPLASRLTTAAAFPKKALGWRGLLAIAAGVAAPKCLVCLLGYAGLAASLGWAGPELCGAGQEDYAGPILAGLVVGLAVAALCGCWRRERS
jgi:hypothetical protein